jgi:phospholipid transport system substrate-binding protein
MRIMAQAWIRGGRINLVIAGLLFGLLAFAGPFTSPASADSHEKGASLFVREVADQAVRALTGPDISRSRRIEQFRRIFKAHFAVEPIGRWILGRHWRRATVEERGIYLSLFEDLIVISYVDRFARYTGETLTINRTLAYNEKTAMVFSEIVPAGGSAPIRIDWRVGSRNGVYRILDLTVEGLSMRATP